MKLAELLTAAIPSLVDDIDDSESYELSLVSFNKEGKEQSSSIVRIGYSESLGYHVTSTEVYN